MSDFFAPSYWYGAGPNFSGLANAQNQYNQNQNYFGNQAATMSAAHVPQSQLYGGGSFGAQPAYYAGVGAAYGRATGGFGGYGAPNADPFTPVTPPAPSGGTPFRGVSVASSPFDVPNAGAVPYPQSSNYFGAEPSSSIGSTPRPSNRFYSPPPTSGFGGGGGVTGVPYQPPSNDLFSDLQPQPSRGFQATPEFSTSQPQSGLFEGLSETRYRPRTAGPGYDPSVSQFTPNTDTSSIYEGFPSSAGSSMNRLATRNVVPSGFDATAGSVPKNFDISPFATGTSGVPYPGAGDLSPFTRGASGVPYQNAVGFPNAFELGGASPVPYFGRGFVAEKSPFDAGTSPVPYQSAGGQAFPGAGIGSYRSANPRDQIADAVVGLGGDMPFAPSPQVSNTAAKGDRLSFTPSPPSSVPPPNSGGPTPMSQAQDRLRAGRGWTIAQPPPAANDQNLTNKINQSIFDLGQSGDYYGRRIGGPGALLPNQGQGLTPQDLMIPHAYPPGVRR